MTFHKIACAVWKHPADVCDCGATPPAPTAFSQGEVVDHADATKVCTWLLYADSDGAFPMDLPRLRNLARSHAALVQEVGELTINIREVYANNTLHFDRAEAAERRVAELLEQAANFDKVRTIALEFIMASKHPNAVATLNAMAKAEHPELASKALAGATP